MRFNFDFISFLIGFVTASIIAGILYRLRRQIAAVQATTATQAGTTRRFLTNTAEGRYLGDLVKSANTAHIAGDVVALSEIYVEPHFIRAVEPYDPQAEQVHRVFHVVPILHDLPALYAPYNVDVLTVNDLRRSDEHLALLGLPGSGKSTALAILALLSAGDIDIPTIDMMADAVFEDEIKDLNPDDREKAIRQRQDLQARALAQLAQSQEKNAQESPTQQVEVDFTKLLPILIHLRDLDLRPETYAADGKTVHPLDPAEPIVKALQRRANVVTASALPRLVYNRLSAGRCLVLIDGYDDLSPNQRLEKLAWLQHFLELYPANFVIVTGPVTGFDPLVNLGLTPVYLRAWSDNDYEQLVRRWTAAWPAIAGSGRRKASTPEDQILRRVGLNNRGRSPLDMTLKVWAAFAADEKLPGRRGWYDFYVRRLVINDAQRQVLQGVAAAIADEDGRPLSKDKLKTVVTALLTGADGRVSGNVEDAIGKVTHSGLMIDGVDDSYGFMHSPIAAFLAAESLEHADADRLKAIAAKDGWDAPFAFAAAVVNLDPVVLARFNQPNDILFTKLFSTAPWLTDSMASAGWRAEVLKQLSIILLAPSQFPVIRERAAAALVTSRDSHLQFAFEKARVSGDPLVRRLACIALGALGDGEAIKDIVPMLKDSDPDVQLAAGLALGAIGSETALDKMLDGMVEGEQNLRQAVAEALAAIPGQGHTVLREAVNAKDMMVRHAAVFGLSRIKAAWALALLYRTLLEDEQWYVRNAAEQAFRQAEGLEGSGVAPHPEADSLNWLIAWAGTKGEGVPAGQGARQVLVRALQEGDVPSRVAAAHTLANLGYVPALKPLYSALRDRDEHVRAAAYESLVDIQERLGTRLPGVN
ncbi:MAG TPA: HEAT repeat domain-containing protein [Aggregatilineales bacterium]|nr:HEAT repeat domain-containing protein [Aggregatilineales bacterium]